MKTFKTEQEARDYSVSNPSETVECKSHFSNGNILRHRFYVNGKKHGEYKSYYYDGQLDEHGFFVNDKEINLDHLKDRSYKSLCIKHTLFDGNLFDN